MSSQLLRHLALFQVHLFIYLLIMAKVLASQQLIGIPCFTWFLNSLILETLSILKRTNTKPLVRGEIKISFSIVHVFMSL